MSRFRVLDYLKKYQILIVVLSLLSGVIFYAYMQHRQSYTATAIINYTNSAASQGDAPDGTPIDVSEIYSVQVMTEVFERMGLDYTEYNLDELRSRVAVNEAMSEEEKAVQEAKNSNGEEVTSKPTRYYVSFTAERGDSDQPEEFARQMLDNILDVYIKLYGEQHINSLAAVNDISKLDEGNYDYLEMLEILDDSISSALENLNTKFAENEEFRSTATGYTFMDIYNEFYLLRKVELSDVFAYVLGNKVTKDGDALLAKYENKIQNYYLNNSAGETEIQAIHDVVDSYVRMMRESGNTDITYEYILENVYENNSAEESADSSYRELVDHTVEYDVLLSDYADNRKDFEWSLIEIAYCEYIREIYSGEISLSSAIEIDGLNQEETAEPGAAEAAAEGAFLPEETTPVQAAAAVSTEEAIQTAEGMISDLVNKTNRLYDILAETNEEYNEYGGAANVSLLSNVVVFANQRVLLYAAIVVVIFLCVFCVAAVILGRLGDIVDYYVYRDRKYELPNRIGCDKFMESYANQILPENFSCVVLRLTGISGKNGEFGREATDDMMMKFNGFVKNTYPKNDECFVALNGVGQWIIYARNMSVNHMEAYASYLQKAVEEYNETAKCKIEYDCGMAESKASSTYRIKLLLMNALHNMKPAIRIV